MIEVANFKMDNGIEGPGRVERTATGFKTTVFYEGKPDLEFSLNRGVDLEERPYVDIDFECMDTVLQRKVLAGAEDALIASGMGNSVSHRSHSKLRVYTTLMEQVLKALQRSTI